MRSARVRRDRSWRGLAAGCVVGVLAALAAPFDGEPAAAPESRAGGLWVGRDVLATRPMTGPAWANLLAAAARPCGPPRLNDQADSANVCVMAKALVHARTGAPAMRAQVMDALRAIADAPPYEGRALALGRGLAAYVIAADLIDLGGSDPPLDAAFRRTITALATARMTGGPRNLVDCHERRPNNWGTHCGASRAAVAAYLGDTRALARVAAVFRGYVGDRAAYSGFTFGDLSWQCDAGAPVGINPAGCRRGPHSIDGVVPDDQRRGGPFTWPPPKENYVYEAMQGALVQAVILDRAGYRAFEWEDRAILRVFEWLHTQAKFAAVGDDTWQPHVVNYYYGSSFPAPVPSRPGKNVGWTDFTHAGRASAR